MLDDFAHHPTAVRVTLEGLRARFPDSRLIAVFEPRSLTSAQNFFFDEYCEAFSHADEVFFAPVFHGKRFSDDERLDLDGIAAFLRGRGIDSHVAQSIEEIRLELPAQLAPGDVVITMSSGSLEGLPMALLGELHSRFPANP